MATDERTRLIDDPAKALIALSPVKRRLLEALREPGSAASLAIRLNLPRQRLGYHLRALEAAGLVRLVEERRRRGFVERVLVADAHAFIVDPALLDGQKAAIETQDKFAAQHLVGVAAEIVREVTRMRSAAEEAGQRLLTFTIEADIGFESPQDFEDFTHQLADAMAALARRYPGGAGRRNYRVVTGAHPAAGATAANSSKPIN